MKIGLVRHFKVDIMRSFFMSAEEFDKYTAEYDVAGVIKNELVVDKEWDKCYCSSLSRAITTAKTIYHGEIILTDKLVEIPTAAWVKLKFHIPYHLWAIINRIAWIRNNTSQPESRKLTLKRINEILDVILEEKDKNILIVSHAGILYEVRKILLARGFHGDRFLKASNGKLYVYENKNL